MRVKQFDVLIDLGKHFQVAMAHERGNGHQIYAFQDCVGGECVAQLVCRKTEFAALVAQRPASPEFSLVAQKRTRGVLFKLPPENFQRPVSEVDDPLASVSFAVNLWEYNTIVMQVLRLHPACFLRTAAGFADYGENVEQVALGFRNRLFSVGHVCLIAARYYWRHFDRRKGRVFDIALLGQPLETRLCRLGDVVFVIALEPIEDVG